MPSWIGPWEIAIVVVIALLIFGPKRLPDLGSSLGRSITGFKKGLKDTKDEVKTAMAETPAEATATAEAPPAAATKTPVAAVTTAATQATASAEQS
jgi:sec-independent protein translocase protein TatA